MKLFSDPERVFLRNLQDSPIWVSIMKKISGFSRVPRYQSGKDDTAQESGWKYESGRLDERESIVSLLMLSENKINLEK